MLPSTVVRVTAKVLAAGPAAASATLALALMGDLAGAGATSAAPTESEFTISGEVEGLYPGAVVVLDARVTNPRDVPIEVTSVAVAVSDAGPGCPASTLHIGAMTATVEVAPRSGAIVPVEVSMVETAADACQGASWPLEFSARAVGPDGDVMTASEPTGPGAFPLGDPTAHYPAAEIGALVALTLIATGLLAWRVVKHHHAAGA